VRAAVPERLDSAASVAAVVDRRSDRAGRRAVAADRWHHDGYDVVAAYDTSGESLVLALRDTAGRRWSVGRLAAPAHYIFWLDRGVVDSAARRGLARAFDESALYGDEVRTASIERSVRSPRRAVMRTARWERPRARVHVGGAARLSRRVARHSTARRR
jgi:hypothetical protein